ncbi:hypothetical protein N9L33_04355 [Nitrospinae bacterium]|jgi:hypothetical protein|nr:hypothetical protein [Nitrospinota bacterium]
MKKSSNHAMFIDRKMHRSKAFQELSKATTVILLEFYYRRKLEQRGGDWVITNNGQITFSYREEKRIFGYAPSTMARALSQLVQYGFIDITHQGICTSKDSSRYAISQRWKDYETDNFIKKTRQKDTRKLGFAAPKRKR